MSIRSAAACHISHILASTGGVGEALVYTDSDGNCTHLIGVWNEDPSDARNQIGVGIDGTVSLARCRLRFADLPCLDPAATITRVATSEVWDIVQHDVSVGVSRTLRLGKRTAAVAPGRL